MSPLIVIVGPTGSGKSHLALSVAEQFGGEVVNCDSVQVYRGFDIGTAKLPPAERRGIPHHLLDIADPDEVFTAGDYQRVARATLHDIAGRGKLPVVAGGTGFYLRALLEGLFAGPERDEAVRRRLEARAARRPDSLHRLLRRLDPAAARVIHGNDRQKLIRALEVCLQARRPITSLHAEGAAPLEGFRTLKIGLAPERAALVGRIHQRSAEMFANGLIEEVQGLLARGVPQTAKPFESLGYAQALATLRGEMSVDDAIVATQIQTRQYAKRQMTWFRRDPEIRWLSGFGQCPETHAAAIEIARAFLDEFKK